MVRRVFTGISVALFFTVTLFAQSVGTAPAFDIADVHVSAHSTNPNMTGGVIRGGRYELRKATMLDLIRTAYGVDADSVIGGPRWLESDRFDMIAKAPAATSLDAAKQMLQTLLADRFKLAVHMETRPMPAFVLSLGKGKPKMKESDGSGSPGCQFQQPQNNQPGTVPPAVFNCRHMSMDAFAKNLRQMAGDYISIPVMNSTGLEGFWDFDLKWTFRGGLARSGSDAINIFDAIDNQLGLKLEPTKAPAPVVVVDGVSETPSANPSGVATSLPPGPPPEFEVADIKPSMPGARQNARLQNGRADVQAFPLKSLIMIAWDLNTDELLAGPKWMESARFDIVAKAPMDAAGEQPDFETLRLMLRALLVDRFKITTHTEDRPITGYTLVAVKPKLQKADSASRTRCKEGAPAGAKDARDTNPILSRLVTCQNTTMAQLAEQLQRLAPGYLKTPVVDGTGLEGAWDFTLSFSAQGLLQNPGQRGGGEAASEPNGALSLFDALNKQLGLKLEAQKRSVPVLVIDNIEEKPTDN